MKQVVETDRENSVRITTQFIIFAIILSLPSLAPADDGAPTHGDAHIRYLYHCGYLVETASHILVFDYWEPLDDTNDLDLSQGVIDAAVLTGKPVRVFVSHSHSDHWDPVVLTWREHVEDIVFLFGWEQEPAKDVIGLAAPRASYSDEDLIVHTVNSHHSGVPESAFLVQIDGLVIFFGGDYQGKPARGAESQAAADMVYLREAAELGDTPVDIVFIGAWLGGSNITILEGLAPRVVFPMHDGGKESEYLDYAAECHDADWSFEVQCPERRGHLFTYEGQD